MPTDGQRGTAKDGTPVVWNERLGRAVPINEGGLEQLGGGYLQNPYGTTYREGPRGGLNQVGGPSQAKADEYAKRASGLNTALSGIDRVDRQLRNTRTIGPGGWLTNPTDLSVLNQSVKDLQLRLKEDPYNLGVLNGPDLDILESIIANPGQLKSAVFRKSLTPRLANLASLIGDQYRQQEQTFAATGGRPNALPKLYRSKQSQYTEQEWGHSGRVPAKKSPAKGGYRVLSVE